MCIKFRKCLFVLVCFFSGCEFFLPEKEKIIRNSLPEHIGKDLLIKKCTSCHGLEKALNNKSQDPKFWEDRILFMTKFYGMSSLKEEDQRVLVAYLTSL